MSACTFCWSVNATGDNANSFSLAIAYCITDSPGCYCNMATILLVQSVREIFVANAVLNTSRSMLRVCYQHERANLLRLGLIVEQRPESLAIVPSFRCRQCNHSGNELIWRFLWTTCKFWNRLNNTIINIYMNCTAGLLVTQ